MYMYRYDDGGISVKIVKLDPLKISSYNIIESVDFIESVDSISRDGPDMPSM